MAGARKNIFAKLWRTFKPAIRIFLFPAVGLTYAIICRILMRTVRMKIINFENEEYVIKSGKKFIYGFWDGRHIMLQPFGINKNIVTIASTSDAGEVLTHIHRFYTLTCVRGSSSSSTARRPTGVRRTGVPTIVSRYGMPFSFSTASIRGTASVSTISACATRRRMAMGPRRFRFILPSPSGIRDRCTMKCCTTHPRRTKIPMYITRKK